MIPDCMMMKTKKTDEKSPPAQEKCDFMQLRNRRLYKSSTGLMVIKKRRVSRNSSISKPKAKTMARRNHKAQGKIEEKVVGGPPPITYLDGVLEIQNGVVDVGVGQNLLEKDREIGESTPGNLVMGKDNIIANCSSTIAPCDGGSRISKRLQGGCIPSAEDIDNFFAAFELNQEKYFKEKYNFDFKNESPLPGRYEWVKVEP